MPVDNNVDVTDRNAAIWPVSLDQIENVVSAHLGSGRVPGNKPGPCLSRHVSMYLAKHVGGWSLPKIGRFYNGRHHTTVLHAITKVERLRKKDEGLDALIEVLTAELSFAAANAESMPAARLPSSSFIDAIASRVIERLAELRAADSHSGARVSMPG